MSSESSGSDSDEGVLSPFVNLEPRVHSLNPGRYNSSPSRRTVGGMDSLRDELWMESYEGERSLFNALGYVTDPQYEHFRARYDRTDTAPALVDKLPKKAWSKPTIVDPEAGDEQSQFEKEINQFLDGQHTEEDPIKVMERATRMERLGNFSLIFIGFNDDGAKSVESEDDESVEGNDDPVSGVEALSNPVDSSSLDGKDPGECVMYLTPYDQGRADFDSIEWYDDDPTHPRFGKPKSYSVDLGDGRPNATIHHDRVIHVVGDIFDNEYQSPSVLKQSLNRIDDVEKILGGSAEGYWRAAYQGLIISPPEVNGQLADFTDSGEELHGQINRYINNFSREIFTAANIDTIDANVEDPSGHLESQYKDLAMGHDLPQSILMGNETGERATSEDRQMFHERAAEFRLEYCGPVILHKFINRLIELKAVSEPSGGKYLYEIEWPALAELSEQEEWNIAQTKSNAISTGTGGEPFRAMSPQEYREKVLGWKPTIGAEVDEATGSLEPATADDLEDEDSDDLEVDEDDERVNDQFMRYHAQAFGEGDKVDTPDGRGVIVEVLTEGIAMPEDVVEVKDVEASPMNPTYVAVVENEDVGTGFYKAGEIQLSDWTSEVDNPAADLQEAAARSNDITEYIKEAIARFNVAGDGHFRWPESWRKSPKPARLIAMDAWASMGGSVSGCIREMRGNVADPGRFCADFADRLYMWEYWRGDSWAPGE